MLGRPAEQQPIIYSEDDVTRYMLDFIGHGVKPPEEILTKYVPDSSIELKSWPEIQKINQVNAAKIEAMSQRRAEETLFESRKPSGIIRKALATAAVVFTAGINR